MKGMKIVALLVILALTYTMLTAQVIEQGTLKMAMIDAQSSDPNIEAMIGMMKGSVIETSFKGTQQRVTMEVMNGMVKTVTLSDVATKQSDTYMDMMGQKIKLSVSPEETARLEEESKRTMGEGTISIDRSITKEILGYNCYLGTYQAEVDDQVINVELYITDAIKVPQMFVQNTKHLQVDGTPLEMTVDMGMARMTYQATSFNQQLDLSFFSPPTGNYTEMTLEQLQQMGLGGAMGY